LRVPKFENLLKVLRREEPDRPTLFEFIVSSKSICTNLSGYTVGSEWNTWGWHQWNAAAFMAAGYDFAVMSGSDFEFPTKPAESKASRSMDGAAVILDQASFDAYEWPDPAAFDYSNIDKMASELPEGAKTIICGPGGVLENVMALVGYQGLCYMLADDPALLDDVFAEVGARLTRYYELSARRPGIGAIISNDDWGFKSQLMLPPALMRRLVFPWHKSIVEVIHAAGHPAMLHSCGNIESVMDDIIDDMKFDGKHSYEDTICPVEQMYDRYHDRIAILGGIDLDFLCRSTPEQIYARSKAMLDRSAGRGGYALGSGNSIPEYVPQANYFAMLSAATGSLPNA
jgi:uroporphyrinogen decarboxylase